VPYQTLFPLIRKLNPDIHHDHVFVDIGCGKGRVLLAAMQLGFSKVVGIELSAVLAKEALLNVSKSRWQGTNATILNQSADEFDFTLGTSFFFHNPFGPSTFRRVLQSLERGLFSNPRPIRLMYYRSEHEDVFDEFEWLQAVDRFCAHGWSIDPCLASIWQNFAHAKPSDT
jgi:SAM-dependent methyltransferase